METKALGNRGERLAAEYLRQQGYRILAQNFRVPVGEIDLIAADADVLVFVEVKTRRSSRYGRPALAVDVSKQRRIIQAAQWYLRQQEEMPCCRFDVLEVYQAGMDTWCVHHIADAFEVRE